MIEGAPYGTVGQTVKQGATKVVASTREVWQDSKANAELNEIKNMKLSLERLAEIKELGLITEEEYKLKRKKDLKN